MQPYRVRYWLNAHPKDPVGFRAEVQTVCQLYEQAPELLAQGVHVISSDEMTGIQALERIYPTETAGMEQVERQEFEYIRHGTQSLIACLAGGNRHRAVTLHCCHPWRGRFCGSHCQHDQDRCSSWLDFYR